MCGHRVAVFLATLEATHRLQRVGTVNVLYKEFILAEDSPHITVQCI